MAKNRGTIMNNWFRRNVVWVLIAVVVLALVGVFLKVRQRPFVKRLTPTAPQLAVSFEEKLLATIPEGYGGHRYVSFSHGGVPQGHLVFKNGELVSIRAYKQADNLDWPVFSPDGKRVAYRAEKDDKWFAVVGDQMSEALDFIYYPVFSADGTKVAWQAGKEGKRFVILNGQKFEEFDSVGVPVFSPDGSRLAYRANHGDKWFLIINGSRYGDEFDSMADPVFSPDSNRVAFRAKQSDKWVMVLDVEVGRGYDELGEPVFSPDSRKVAYQAKTSADWMIIVKRKKQKKFDLVGDPLFSPDGKKVAYWAKKGDKFFLVLNGKKKAEFDSFADLAFSPIENSLAYAAFEKIDAGPASGILKGFVVVKGRRWDATYLRMEGLVFSPDGKRVALRSLSVRTLKWYVVLDGQRQEEFDEIGRVIFDPDSRRVAYWARRNNREFVIVGNRKGEEFDFVTNPVFSPDGTKVAYGARKGRELWWKVLATTE
ncbi:MAG: hypothetical protein ACYSW7_09575 [Planctomycetota bacterium]